VVSNSFPNQAKPPAAKTVIMVNGREIPLFAVRHPRARRYVLRLRPDGSARLTIPRRGSQLEGRRFVESQTAWLAKQLQKLSKKTAKPQEWVNGTSLLLRGIPATLKVDSAPDRMTVAFDGQLIAIPTPPGNLRLWIEQYLRTSATRELTARVLELALLHDLKVSRITIRSQRSRWGSCSPKRTISLNWKLIQAPPSISDYIILHELMHLRQMNHSARFWKEVERVCPDYQSAERWLRQNSGLLND
jgi:predicted metal-dependent hydrolase